MCENNIKEVMIKIFPEINDAYKVIISVDDRYDVEEQIDSWIDENLKFVQEWEFGEEMFYDDKGNIIL